MYRLELETDGTLRLLLDEYGLWRRKVLGTAGLVLFALSPAIAYWLTGNPTLRAVCAIVLVFLGPIAFAVVMQLVIEVPRIEWEVKDGRLRIRTSGVWIWQERTATVPFEQMQDLRVVVSGGLDTPGGALGFAKARAMQADHLRLTVTFRQVPPEGTPGKVRTFGVAFQLPQLDRREEAVDLVARIGRAVGASGMVVERNDVRFLQLYLPREPVRDAQPLPTVPAKPDYSRPAAAHFEEPAVRPEPVDDARWPLATRAVKWAPGQRVEFRSRARSAVRLLLVAALFAGIGYLGHVELSPWLATRFGLTVGVAQVASALFIAGCIVGYLWLVSDLGTQGLMARFDWEGRTLLHRHGVGAKTVPFASLGLLVVRPKFAAVDRLGNAHYWCELSIRHGGAELLLAVTHRHRNDEVSPMRHVMSVAVELGRALDVAVRVEG